MINILKTTLRDKKFNLGFTLVELLIVIGLLGAIALIVIAAINPIEQANRARDTRFKADGGQLISALDRYFTGGSQFPWMVVDPLLDNEDSYGFVTASDQGIGICGATCSADGLLLTSNELKSEFRNRDFISATLAGRQLFIGKAAGANASVYACFVPLSKSVRDKAITDGKVYTISATLGTRTVTDTCDTTWADTCFICIPE